MHDKPGYEERRADAPEVQTGGTQSKFSIGKLEADALYASMIAGGILLFMEMLFGTGLITPFRFAASVIMGEHAFDGTPLIPIIAGVVVHISACCTLGFIFGVVASLEVPATQERWQAQVWRGALFGAIVWLVDFQLIARFVYPWFMGTNLLVQFVLHVLFYGVPLGILYARLRSRRVAIEPLRTPSLSREHEETAVEESLTHSH